MKKSDEKRLQSAIEDILWMAARYAHGRHTYAPSTVRDSVKVFTSIFPDFKIKQDHVIEPPSEDIVGGMSFRSDYLDDIFNKRECEITIVTEYRDGTIQVEPYNSEIIEIKSE
jgi:hypothetical protein